VNVRLAVEADIPAVLRVQTASAEAPQWDEARYREMLEAQEGWPRRALFIAEDQGRIAGFIVVASVLDDAEIESIAVAPDSRRQGFGQQLCQAALGWACAQGASQLRLEVRAGNEVARTVYSRLGFEINGLRRAYYSDPIEDAVILVKGLPSDGL